MTAPPPFDFLDPALVEKILRAALARGARFSEIFIERRVVRGFRRDEGLLREVTDSVEAGAGVRAIAGEATGYAYTSVATPESLLEAAAAAGRIASGGNAGPPFRVDADGGTARPPAVRATPIEPIATSILGRAAWLEEVEASARSVSPKVREVRVSIGDSRRTFFVANSSGRRTGDEQTRCSGSVTVHAEGGDGRLRRGSHGGGGTVPFATIVAGALEPRSLGAEAARRALVMTEAVEAPAGEMPVVIGNGWGGVLLHESIGHGFEGDFVRRRTSVYADRLGQRIGSPLCTVVDDGSVPALRGSFGADDEGSPSARTLLVERGVLRGYLHDLLSAETLGAPATGNGRRHSFRHPPVPRQSNIFMEPGEDAPEDLIRGVRRGLLARTLGGGQVDIVNGNFVFEVTEGYLIEDGKVTAPVRGATLIGTGHEVLARLEKVANDFAFDPGLGTCGKDGQSQPVGVGQPTLLVSAMTVGGTRL